MTSQRLLGLTGLLFMLAPVGDAAAQSMPSGHPPGATLIGPVSPGDWTGMSMGLHLGYAFGDSILDPLNMETLRQFYEDFIADPARTIALDVDDESNGIYGGFSFGLDMQADRLAYGVIVDVSGLTIDGQAVITDNGIPIDTFDVSLTTLVTMRGRVGAAMERALPYLHGGLAIGGATLTNEFANGLGGYYENVFDESLVGFTVGAGLELVTADQIAVKIEYQYVDLGQTDFDDYLGYALELRDSAFRFSTVGVGLVWRPN